MSELISRQLQGRAQKSVDHSDASKLADGLLAVAVLATSAAITITWIATLYWIAGAFFSD